MGTVSKSIADQIIAGDYPEDAVVRIIKYINNFNGGDSYGVIFEGEDPNRYEASEFVINPVLYWTNPNLPKKGNP